MLSPREARALAVGVRRARFTFDPWRPRLVAGDCLACGGDRVVEFSPYCPACGDLARKVAGR